MANDFEQRIAAMSREQMSVCLLQIAALWAANKFENVGVVLEDNGLTEIDEFPECPHCHHNHDDTVDCLDDCEAGNPDGPDEDYPDCSGCGRLMVVNDDGTTNHVYSVDYSIDYDADADHAAYHVDEEAHEGET